MKHGIALPNWAVDGDTASLVEYAVEAEEAGWDGVLLCDHLIFPPSTPDETPSEHGAFPDPWITFAGIAARTSDIRLVSWITPIPRRQPWQLARDLATLDHLSEGRVILGTGLGRASDYLPFGEPWEPKRLGRTYDEALDVITGLWGGEPFSYHGEHFTIDDAVVLPTPVQEPRVPIIVGGLWPNKKPFHRAARWDGMIPHYPGDGIIPEEGIEGQVPSAERDPEDTVRAMLEYYRDLTDDPGEIFLPADPPHRSPGWRDLCDELGVTWLYTRPRDESDRLTIDMNRIRSGPP